MDLELVYTSYCSKLRVFKRLAVGAVGNRTYRAACRDREIAPTEDAISGSAQYKYAARYGLMAELTLDNKRLIR